MATTKRTPALQDELDARLSSLRDTDDNAGVSDAELERTALEDVAAFDGSLTTCTATERRELRRLAREAQAELAGGPRTGAVIWSAPCPSHPDGGNHECMKDERRCVYCAAAIQAYGCHGCNAWLTAARMHAIDMGEVPSHRCEDCEP